MIAILDYDAGNIKSVEKAISSLGHTAKITRDSKEILSASHVILPGVGAFGEAMNKLSEYELIPVIHDVIRAGTPFLGICLGQQLLFDSSEESPEGKGLGLIPGRIVRLPESGLKIPQIGWNSLDFPKAGRLFNGIDEGSFVYFVHSYYLDTKDNPYVTATCDYGATVGASVEKDNIFACQFHPEKSSDIGLKILSNFIQIK